MKTAQKVFIFCVVMGLMAAFAMTAPAAATGTAIYNSIPDPLPGNLPSQPYQAQQTAEVGDYIRFAGTARNLTSVTVTMSSWARHSEYPDCPQKGLPTR